MILESSEGVFKKKCSFLVCSELDLIHRKLVSLSPQEAIIPRNDINLSVAIKLTGLTFSFIEESLAGHVGLEIL